MFFKLAGSRSLSLCAFFRICHHLSDIICRVLFTHKSSYFCRNIISVSTFQYFNLTQKGKTVNCIRAPLLIPTSQSFSCLLSPSFLPIPISPCASGMVSFSIPPSLHSHSFIYSNHLLCVHCFPCSHWLCMSAAVFSARDCACRQMTAHMSSCICPNCILIRKCACLIAFKNFTGLNPSRRFVLFLLECRKTVSNWNLGKYKALGAWFAKILDSYTFVASDTKIIGGNRKYVQKALENALFEWGFLETYQKSLCRDSILCFWTSSM